MAIPWRRLRRLQNCKTFAWAILFLWALRVFILFLSSDLNPIGSSAGPVNVRSVKQAKPLTAPNLTVLNQDSKESAGGQQAPQDNQRGQLHLRNRSVDSGFENIEIQASPVMQTLFKSGLGPDAVDVKKIETMKFSVPQLIQELRQDVVINYPAFKIRKPQFFSSSDWELFSKHERHKEVMAPTPTKLLRGVVNLVSNATITNKQSCGWMTEASEFKLGGISRRSSQNNVPLLCPVLVPIGNSFQHFIDGTLPKIIQGLPLLLSLQQTTDLVIMLQDSVRDQIVVDMMVKLGFNPDRIRWSRQQTYTADVMVSTCATPPLHPILWQKARTLLGGSPSPRVPFEESHIILLTRAFSRHSARHIRNFDQVSNYLSERYGSRLVIFKGHYNLEESVALFSKAGVIIGVHGGAFYNFLFSPRNTVVLEIMPTTKSGRLPNLTHTIIWAMADMLELAYWRLPIPPVGGSDDVIVPLEVLSGALDRVEGKV